MSCVGLAACSSSAPDPASGTAPIAPTAPADPAPKSPSPAPSLAQPTAAEEPRGAPQDNAPQDNAPQDNAPQDNAPMRARGRDATTTAVAARGTITVRFRVHDPCDASRPRVAIDPASRTIEIKHKNRMMRCGGGQLDYKTTIDGLPAETFAVAAPGLPSTRIRVPSAAAVIAPTSRSVDITPKGEPREVREF